MRHRWAKLHLPALAFSALAASCSGSGGGSSALGFQLPRISLPPDAEWKVNQEIAFTFSEAVDFSTVSLNTISILTSSGMPATGTFFLRAPEVVVFQPNCPTREDLSDTGLMAGGESYVLRVLGRSSGAANTVRSASGVPLDVTQVRNFTTPEEGQTAFLDTVVGPPLPVVRMQGSSEQNATYMQIGGDPNNRVYFERDSAQDIVLSVPGFEAPLNLYSDASSRIAFVIEFNQALFPSAMNISSSTMRLEFLDGLLWTPLETQVTLVGNCIGAGARVRLEPVGVLPQGSELRAVVLAGIQDLVGDATQNNNDTFAVAPTRAADFSSLVPSDSQSDEFPEPFDFGGSSSLSFEDTGALFDTPSAAWGNGRLTAAFDFSGSGGPGGTFDWLVQEGDSIVVDTDGGAVLGADGFTVQSLTNGRLDVRNMTIEDGGEVRVQGSRPFQISATGTVFIRGLLDASGFDARDVVQLDSGDRIEFGAEGGPGGGRGGNANEVVTNSTPRGSVGQGPPGTVNAGASGGETGFAVATLSRDSRRPGGGGGGRFAANQGSLIAGAGLNGAAEATGATTNQKPPAGGATNAGPFTDTSTDNNFFGSMAVGVPGDVTALIRGELPGLWGGYGGGGGGNANPASLFPTPNWTKASDEKGAAGGGGGGGILIRALGPIQFGVNGLIRCDGGRGGIGENVLAEDHIGGNGGSGSGGHVILETASFIDFTDGGATSFSRDWISAVGGPQVAGATTPAGSVSFGGAGGPGVIQLHVPDSLTPPDDDPMTTSLVVPTQAVGSGDPLDAVTSPRGLPLVPEFGAQSQARSKWISIGGADRKPGGIPAQLLFLFRGIETAVGPDEGKILASGEEVQELPALLDADLEGNPDAVVLGDRVSLRLSGSSLDPFSGMTNGVSNDLYLRNPSLMEDFVLRLSVATVEEDFRVAAASYDEGATNDPNDQSLTMTIADEGRDLQDFINENTSQGTIQYMLVPRFFRVVTGGEEGRIPMSSYVRILFQATDADGNGQPNATPLVDWTADISQFNSTVPGDLQFFRFEVEFELNDGGMGVSPDTEAISLDFLRIPFVF